MRCENGHFEIIFDSTLTPECPLCKALNTEPIKNEIDNIISIIEEYCLTSHINIIHNKLEEL